MCLLISVRTQYQTQVLKVLHSFELSLDNLEMFMMLREMPALQIESLVGPWGVVSGETAHE